MVQKGLHSCFCTETQHSQWWVKQTLIFLMLLLFPSNMQGRNICQTEGWKEMLIFFNYLKLAKLCCKRHECHRNVSRDHRITLSITIIWIWRGTDNMSKFCWAQFACLWRDTLQRRNNIGSFFKAKMWSEIMFMSLSDANNYAPELKLCWTCPN